MPTFLFSGGKNTLSLDIILFLISITPESGLSKPAINLKAVVLPDPEIPRIPTIEPFQTSKLKSVKTTSCPYDFVTDLALIINFSNAISCLNSLYLVYM